MQPPRFFFMVPLCRTDEPDKVKECPKFSISFSWMNPLMENGSLRRIEPEDLFGLDKELDASFNCKQIWAEWAKVWLRPL